MRGTARCIVILLISSYELLHPGLCPAQGNLISRPSFEDSVGLSWSTIYPTTADYFTGNLPPPPSYFYSVPWNLMGYQFARTGVAYMGIYIYYVIPEPGHVPDSGEYYIEYIKTRLNYALKSGACYNGGMYFVNANYNKRFANRLGVLFADTVPAKSFPTQIQFAEFHKPQIEMDSSLFFTDTLNWQLIDGVFKAKGNEKFAIYGNFYPKERTQWLPKNPLTTGHLNLIGNPYLDSLFAYVYIDDVFLYEIPSARAIRDTALCAGKSTVIGLNNDTTTAAYNWLPATGLSCTNCPNPIATPPNNTTYTLTKTVRGCSTQATVNIKVNPLPQPVFSLSANAVCEGESSVVLNGDPPGGTFTGLNAGDTLFVPSQAGTYTIAYSYTDAENCRNTSAVKSITVYPLPQKPQINKKDTLLCVSRGTITLSASPANGTFYGEGLKGPVFNPKSPGNTTVLYTVSDNNHCKNSDTLIISVLDCAQGKFSIPNVFSPNGDGVNEQWKFELPFGVRFTQVAIYDRWGNLVFERSAELFPQTVVILWDGYNTSGLPCDEGTYYYILQTQNEKQGAQLNRGTITLSR